MTVNLTSEQIKALHKLFSVGIDRANTMLNYLIEWPVQLKMIDIELVSPQELYLRLRQRVGLARISAMELIYRGEIDGVAQLIFPLESAATLVDTIADEERRMLDRSAVKLKTLSEVGNIIFNGAMGSLSNVIKQGITYMAPSYREGTAKELLASLNQNFEVSVLFVKIQFQIEQLQASGDLILFFEVYRFETLLDEIKRNSV